MEAWEMNKKASDSLAEKLGKLNKTEAVKVRKPVITKDSSLNAIVTAKVGEKLDKYTGAAEARATESAVSNYMNKPIAMILKEEPKKAAEVTKAEKKLEEFLDAEYEKAVKLFSGSRLTESVVESKAHNYLNRYIKGTYAHENDDPEAYEAHKTYLQLKDELSAARVESNALLVAKQAYIDENQDIIQEEQKKRRIAELRKSGLLSQLGIEENTEEEQANTTPDLDDLAEQKFSEAVDKITNRGEEENE